jgi:hypothetical protein
MRFNDSHIHSNPSVDIHFKPVSIIMRVIVLFCMLASTLAFSNQNIFKSEFAPQLNVAANKASRTKLEMAAQPAVPPENDEEMARRKMLMSRLSQEADHARLLAAESRYRHYASEGNLEEANRSWKNFLQAKAAKRKKKRMDKIKNWMAPAISVLRVLYFPWLGMLPGQNP